MGGYEGEQRIKSEWQSVEDVQVVVHKGSRISVVDLCAYAEQVSDVFDSQEVMAGSRSCLHLFCSHASGGTSSTCVRKVL